MSTSFVDFVSQQQERKDTAETVLTYVHALIESLKDNYREYAIRGHQRFADGEMQSCQDDATKQYHLRKIEELKNGDGSINYVIESGRKYHKVVMVTGNNEGRSVHCFVDKQTGEIYKPASWNAPAKKVRFNLLHLPSREWVFENADWSGGYLYSR